MNKKRLGPLVRLAAVAFFSLTLAPLVAAQAAKPVENSDLMKELLGEVRALRQALQTLQRMSVDTYRSQLFVDRIRASHEDVRRLTASVNQTHDLLLKTQSTIPQFIERQKLLETQIQSEVDPTKRAEFEFELRRTKESVERYISLKSIRSKNASSNSLRS